MAKAPKSSEPAKRRSIICAARSGGQGKTTIAQLVHTVCQRNNVPHSLYSAEFLGRDARSKLGKLYPGRVTELGIGATFEQVKTSDDMNQSIRYWDRLGDVLVEGGAVIDLGANVIDKVLDLVGLTRADIYITPVFALLTATRSSVIPMKDKRASFEAVGQYELMDRRPIACGTDAASVLRGFGIDHIETIHPSARGLTFDDRAARIAKALEAA